jgi:hypothetical protein
MHFERNATSYVQVQYVGAAATPAFRRACYFYIQHLSNPIILNPSKRLLKTSEDLSRPSVLKSHTFLSKLTTGLTVLPLPRRLEAITRMLIVRAECSVVFTSASYHPASACSRPVGRPAPTPAPFLLLAPITVYERADLKLPT